MATQPICSRLAHDTPEGLQRIKFVTNYPKDMTDDLLEACATLPKVALYCMCPRSTDPTPYWQANEARLHRRRISRDDGPHPEWMVPDVAVASDFIVGFCGETDEEFQATCDVTREFRFKNSFIFKYSERPGTRGADMYADDVPDAVKKQRNNDLLAIQNAISEEDNQPFVGRTVEVLVEGPSKAAEKRGDEGPVRQLTGRTTCDRIVVFDGTERQIGEVLDIAIYDVNAFTLFGQVVTQHVGPELHAIEVG